MTFNFGDPGLGLYGLARLGLAGTDGGRDASALAVLFSGREPVAAIAHGGVQVAADACFGDLELWVGADEGYPRRGAGEVVCGSTLDSGQVRLDCAFLRWRMDGRIGVGRDDVLRRA